MFGPRPIAIVPSGLVLFDGVCVFCSRWVRFVIERDAAAAVSKRLMRAPTEIVVRAWDSAAQAQPARLETVWNVKGYMNNARHRISVAVQ